MITYTAFLGVLGSCLLIFGDLLYVRGVLQKRLRPHAFSWLIWSTLNWIAFAAQLSEGAGPGAWVTCINALSCLIVFFGAIHYGDRRFLRFDWISLLAAGVSLGLWALTNEPLLAIILVVLVDIFGSLPTFRKGYIDPRGEMIKSYAFAALAHVFAIIALENYTLTTWLYPATIVWLDGSLSCMLLIRRKQIPS